MKSSIKIPSEPSPEVIRYFDEKSLRPSFNWRDVWGEEHAHAFTVAKSAGFDILGDVREAVSSALKEGKTFEQFRNELEPALRAKGWWGKKKLRDPKTGELVVSQLGSARRLRVIYEANIRTARAAGQWERAQRTKAALPYFEYRLGPSERHRPHHVEKEGVILPIDDPFWDTWYPPNGWGCKCWLRQISRSAAKEAGGVSERPEVETREYVNTRRGIVEQIPVGIDPGWQTSPGKGRARGLTDRFAERLREEGEDASRVTVAELWSSGAAAALANVEQRIHIPIAVAPKVAKAFDATGSLVTVSSDTVVRKTGKHGHHQNAPVTIETFAQVQRMIDEGDTTGFDGRGGYRIWMRIGGRMHRLVIGKSARGFLYIRTLFQTSSKSFKKAKG